MPGGLGYAMPQTFAESGASVPLAGRLEREHGAVRADSLMAQGRRAIPIDCEQT
jgi:hypothetical protein